MNILSCKHITKQFVEGKQTISVLLDINFELHSSDNVAIIGQSGSGKSTLLHILAGLTEPTNGEVCIKDKNIHSLSEKERCQWRNQQLGFIYQFHHLLPEFSALENVAIPLLIRGTQIKEARERAATILQKVGLGQRLNQKVTDLSGGERQRVAVGRALITQPSLILADEPTGNLDRYNADAVFNLMLELNQEFKTSLLIVTHDESLATRLDQVMVLKDGNLHANV